MLEQQGSPSKAVNPEVWDNAYHTVGDLLDEIADEGDLGLMAYAARAMICAVAVRLVDRLGPLEAHQALRWVCWPGFSYIKKMKEQLQ